MNPYSKQIDPMTLLSSIFTYYHNKMLRLADKIEVEDLEYRQIEIDLTNAQSKIMLLLDDSEEAMILLDKFLKMFSLLDRAIIKKDAGMIREIAETLKEFIER